MMRREGYLAKVNAIANKKIKLNSQTTKKKKKQKKKKGKKKNKPRAASGKCNCDKKRMAKDTMYA